MAEEWTYQRLCDVYREEKSTNSLTPLASDFHRSLQDLISRLSARAPGSPEGQRELDNARKQIRLLARLRRQKLMMRASMEQAGADPEGMTASEGALYARLREIYEQEDAQLESLMHPLPLSAPAPSQVHSASAAPSGASSAPSASYESASARPNSSSNADSPTSRRLKILGEIPQYRGANNEIYGPYTIGQQVELPSSEAEWMLAGKLAEAIQ